MNRHSVLMLVCVIAGCEVQGEDPKADPVPPKVGAVELDWDGVAVRSHRDAPSALRFPIPATGYRVRATHFDPSTPPVKMKHEISIIRDRYEVLRVDVWNDSEGLGLNAWFNRYLGFMATPSSIVETTRAGKAGETAIIVREPRSEQATARRNVIVEIDGRVVRVTQLDEDDARARSIFDGITRDLEVEGAR